ncbi:hypothetical protein CIT292_09050 [Citrobacter youngae ATCC 29220]|uniref:Uncharacterized protein n=1 Tax=Citrobacter youngae ATCC 29220 TaxID=500640 RepID=D4BFN0_9ENTR|nr:hypothetical protein CIT292_09050 [Citrobacter youngae ATCC 29220]
MMQYANNSLTRDKVLPFVYRIKNKYNKNNELQNYIFCKASRYAVSYRRITTETEKSTHCLLDKMMSVSIKTNHNLIQLEPT